MAKNKTTENENSVTDYLTAINDNQKRNDCAAIIKIIKKQTGFEPKMWGTGIIGFGSYHYRYESGREGDAPLLGFAARANSISLYLSLNTEQRERLLAKFGKYKTGKGCIYIQKLEDVDINIFEKIVADSFINVKEKYIL